MSVADGKKLKTYDIVIDKCTLLGLMYIHSFGAPIHVQDVATNRHQVQKCLVS